MEQIFTLLWNIRVIRLYKPIRRISNVIKRVKSFVGAGLRWADFDTENGAFRCDS